MILKVTKPCFYVLNETTILIFICNSSGYCCKTQENNNRILYFVAPLVWWHVVAQFIVVDILTTISHLIEHNWPALYKRSHKSNYCCSFVECVCCLTKIFSRFCFSQCIIVSRIRNFTSHSMDRHLTQLVSFSFHYFSQIKSVFVDVYCFANEMSFS
jgi:hypothetical protein